MPLTDEQKSNLAVFEKCGLEYVYRNKQCKATCPFCDKRGHFYINPDTTKWDCKSCGKRGNNYSFLTHYVDSVKDETEHRELVSLRRLRGNFVPTSTLRRFEIFQNGDGEWCIPVRNRKGTVINLRRWTPKNKGVFGLAGLSSGLFNVQNLKDKGPVYICEGEWDAIALDWMLKAAKIKNYSVVACPGATSFKETWKVFFRKREVYLCFDNDEAGQEGMQRTARILSQSKQPPTIFALRWPEGTPDKYDIRDLVIENKKRPNDGAHYLQGLFQELSLEEANQEPAHEPLERNSFEEVLEDFKQVYHVTDEMRDCLLCCFAAMATVPIRRDPVWLMLVGPPGSGKSTIIDAFRWCTEKTVHHSTMDARTMVTGYRGEDGNDSSLIYHIDGRTLFITDLTAILGLPASVQIEFFGLIRTIYDGHFYRMFGNKKEIDVKDVNFSIIAGVTPEIHRVNHSTLGERFIKLNITGPDFNPENNIRAAIKGNTQTSESSEFVCASVLGFVNTLNMDPTKAPSTPEWFDERMIALIQIVAYLRTKIHKDRDSLTYRQEPEVATRLGKQLKKLGQGVAYVLKKDYVDKECYRIVKKAALDTCMGIPLEIISSVMRESHRGVKALYIAEKLQLSETQVKNVLRGFQELGVVVYSKARNNSGRRGRNVYLWRPTWEFKDLWERAGLGSVRPGVTPSKRADRTRKRVR